VSNKDGELSILIKLIRLKLRDSMKNLDSTSTDHSTSDQDSHSRELQSATVPTMSGSRDGELTRKPSNGTLMRFLRPSRTTTGNHIHLIFNPMEVQPTSDALLPTQDGGKCSDIKVLQL
jgi:hypothetical protein